MLQVGALPLDLLDAAHQPDFSAVRLDDEWRWVGVGEAVGVGVGVGAGYCPQYLPPVFVRQSLPCPPQTIISLPVQTARVRVSGSGRVGGAGGYPTIRAGIVSPAGV